MSKRFQIELGDQWRTPALIACHESDRLLSAIVDAIAFVQHGGMSAAVYDTKTGRAVVTIQGMSHHNAVGHDIAYRSSNGTVRRLSREWLVNRERGFCTK